MKTLLLMRHAKSSWKDESLPDEKRPLNKRGKETAAVMGELLRKKKFVPDLILSSTATRAKQTAKRIVEAGNFKVRIRKCAEMYFSGPEAYLKCIADVPDKVDVLLVIGHNPDLELLTSRVAGENVPLPTGAIARIEVAAEWSSAADFKGLMLKDVFLPKELMAKKKRE